MKFLVYYTVGGASSYVRLLEESVASVRRNNQHADIDVLVMCDQEYVKHMEHLGTLNHVTGRNGDGVQSARRKIEIFDWERVWDYDVVLYLDADIVVSGSLVEPVLKRVADSRGRDVLHVCRED